MIVIAVRLYIYVYIYRFFLIFDFFVCFAYAMFRQSEHVICGKEKKKWKLGGKNNNKYPWL